MSFLNKTPFKILRSALIFVLITAWVFSPWARIDFHFNIGDNNTRIALIPEIQEAHAATTTQVYNATTTGTTFVVPNSVSTITVKVWGGGGGGSGGGGGTTSPGSNGGAGGYTQADIPVTAGESLTVVVGGGGGGGTNSEASGTDAGGGGGGGGFSAVKRSSTFLLVAGGGGGGGSSGAASTPETGGAGGGGGGVATSTDGADGLDAGCIGTSAAVGGGGKGATSAGVGKAGGGCSSTGTDGSAGSGNGGGAGAALGATSAGGAGGSSDGSTTGGGGGAGSSTGPGAGGGGGGYYGGGGGEASAGDEGAGGGGGGVGYSDPSNTNTASSTAGVTVTPPNSTDSDFGTTGADVSFNSATGGTAGLTDKSGAGGQPGRVVIIYQIPVRITGTIYTDEGTTQLNSAGKTIKLRVNGTTYSTTTISGTGVYEFWVPSANRNNETTFSSGLATDSPMTLWVDGDTSFRASRVSVASSSLDYITSFDLYQNRVIINNQSESGTSTILSNLDHYDGDNDPDIQFRANSHNQLVVNAGQMLYLAPGTHFDASIGRVASTTVLTSGTSWIVPSDWNDSDNTIEVIGGGGGGGSARRTGGGGGGAYATISDLSLTPGATVAYAVGTGGSAGSAGGDTYFCNSDTNCASISGTAVQVGAKGGSGATSATGASGGAAGSSVGTTKYSGGTGGNAGDGVSSWGGGGGGGAGGPYGNGANGGASSGSATGAGGGGGGGGGSVGSTTTSALGGDGGANSNGVEAGTGGSSGSKNGTNGMSGAGGGGGYGSATNGDGGNGGAGSEWSVGENDYGSGGGGGGCGDSNPTETCIGGSGGLYGGGGGGAGDDTGSTGGSGAQGVIIISYYSASAEKIIIRGGSSNDEDGSLKFAHGVHPPSPSVSTSSILTLSGGVNLTGSWFASSTGAILNASSSPVIFSATSTNKHIYASSTPFYDLTFDGSGGSWTFEEIASTTNDFTITNGTVVAPSLLSIGGNYTNNSVFTAGTGTTTFDGNAPQTLSGTMTSSSGFNNVEISNNWFNPDWLYRKKIVLKQASSTLADFPLLVSLSDTDLASRAQSDGDDIVFTSSDGTTRLSHEIETYTSGGLTAWVKIPTLSSTASSTEIFMYYGNAATSSEETPNDVWDSNYMGIWHLNESVTDEATGVTGAYQDSTQYVNHGDQYGTANTTGKFGQAQSFDGNDYIELSRIQTYATSTGFTVSLWNNSAAQTDRRLYNEASTASNNPTAGLASKTTTGATTRMYVRNDANTVIIDSDASGVKTAFDSTWHYVTWTDDPAGTGRVYVDGSLDHTYSYTPAGTYTMNKTALGALLRSGIGQTLTGTLDEARVSRATRSADWIAIEYENQSATSTFYTNIGAEEAGVTFSNNASSTNFTIGQGKAVAPALLSISGNYQNNGTFAANSGTTTLNGTGQQFVSGNLGGTSAFAGLEITNTASTTFLAAASSTGMLSASAGARVELFASATTTAQNIYIAGSEGNEVYLHSTTPGTQWNFEVPGGRSVSYANVKDSNACYTSGNNISASNSTDGGNSNCWSFAGGATGTLTLSAHDAGQVSNQFTSSSITDGVLFRFYLTPANESITVTPIFNVSIFGIGQSDLTNMQLFKDTDGSGTVNGAESGSPLGGSGSVSIAGTSGTVTFSAFSISTAANYILEGDIANTVPGTELTVSLNKSKITATGDTSQQSITPTGTVTSANHARLASGGIGGTPHTDTISGSDQTGGVGGGGEGTGDSPPPPPDQGGGGGGGGGRSLLPPAWYVPYNLLASVIKQIEIHHIFEWFQ